MTALWQENTIRERQRRRLWPQNRVAYSIRSLLATPRWRRPLTGATQSSSSKIAKQKKLWTRNAKIPQIERKTAAFIKLEECCKRFKCTQGTKMDKKSFPHHQVLLSPLQRMSTTLATLQPTRWNPGKAEVALLELPLT